MKLTSLKANSSFGILCILIFCSKIKLHKAINTLFKMFAIQARGGYIHDNVTNRKKSYGLEPLHFVKLFRHAKGQNTLSSSTLGSFLDYFTSIRVT